MRLEMTLDCNDLEAMASFWSQALGRRVQPVVPGQYVALEPVDGGEPTLALQRVEEPKTAKNRLHLDLLVPDVDAEVARLEALGAHRLTLGAREEFGQRWFVLADPEGNELCVGQERG
ncbi:MAG: VOC family protein [Actinomycetes bacterium]